MASRRRDVPLGLRILGASILLVMAGALAYTVAIAVANVARIGV